jgi:hypothetical protein
MLAQEGGFLFKRHVLVPPATPVTIPIDRLGTFLGELHPDPPDRGHVQVKRLGDLWRGETENVAQPDTLEPPERLRRPSREHHLFQLRYPLSRERPRSIHRSLQSHEKA